MDHIISDIWKSLQRTEVQGEREGERARVCERERERGLKNQTFYHNSNNSSAAEHRGACSQCVRLSVGVGAKLRLASRRRDELPEVSDGRGRGPELFINSPRKCREEAEMTPGFGSHVRDMLRLEGHRGR